MKTIVFLLYTFTLTFLYGQSTSSTLRLEQALKNIDSSEDANFRKTRHFFLTHEYDSALVYSNKYLSSKTTKSNCIQYCRYIRAYSAEEKELYEEARTNYLKLDENFPFFQFVQMKLGGIDLKTANYKKALDHFHGLEASSSNQVDSGILLDNIGICYLHLEDFIKAEEYLKKSSESLIQDASKIDVLISTYTNLANLYYNEYRDEEAIPYFVKAYELSKKTDDFNLKMSASRNMSIVEENRKELASSLNYRKEFDQWKDSLNDQNKVWQIAQLEKKHISDQGKRREQLLQAENNAKIAQRNGFIYSSILLLVLLGTGIFFYIQKLRTNKIILAQKKELAVLNATKDRLFSVVSHDLRSNVNSLRLSNSKLTKYLDEQNYAELREIVRNNGSIANSTYSLLDNLLNWAMIQTEQLYFNMEPINVHSIAEQVSFNYLPLMEEKGIAFENNIARNTIVRADLDSVKIILRNLLDNAIKYSEQNGSIRIYSEDHSGKTCAIIIEDSGIGMDQSKLNELKMTDASKEPTNRGLGLQLCKELIEKNEGILIAESKPGVGTKLGFTLLKSI